MLTEAQPLSQTKRRKLEKKRKALAVLADINASPGKFGKFYCALGHNPMTLKSMHYRQMIESPGHGYPIRSGTIFGVQWVLTDRGRAALDGSEQP